MSVILHLGLVPILSGVQNVMIQILEALENKGHKIIVASAPGGELVAEVEKKGWKHLPIKSLVREINPKKDFLAAKELAIIIKNEKVDILHTHSSKTGLLGRIVGRLCRVPKILHTVHGYPFHKYQNPLLHKFYVFSEFLAGHFCDYLITVNQEDAIIAHKKLKIPLKRIKYIPNGAQAQTERKILTNDGIIIGTLSRFWKQKNMLKCVKTAIKACQLRKELKFVLVGDGEDLDFCQNLVLAANLSDRIILPGWSSEKDKWLKMFDIFILYSLWEGLPLSILEAMSYGLPIIASNIKGNRELVDNRNGFLVDPEEESELLNLLLKLPSIKADLQEKGKASYQKILNEYSLDNFNENYQKLYKSIENEIKYDNE